MESASHLLLSDLAIIAVAATLSMRLFALLKLPQLLGFIFTGMLLSPVLDVIRDKAAIEELGELGVMFMMFFVGMEFNLDRLKKVFVPSFIGMFFEVAGMVAFGVFAASCMSMNLTAGLFLGGILSMSSTIVIMEIFAQRREFGKPYAQISTGILIMEDLFAVFLLVLLVGLSSGKPDLGKLGLSTLSMLAFVIAIFVVGKLTITYALKKLALSRNPQETVMFTLCLMLGLGFLAVKSGMSLALGAFLAGSIISGTFADRNIEQLTMPFRNFFVAVFFVSIGTMTRPEQIVDMWLPIVLITAGLLVFRTIFSFAGIVLSGARCSDAFMTGMYMAQIGEFSFVVAGLGVSMKVFDSSVMVITMGVSFLTVFLNPLLLSAAPHVTKFFEKHTPSKIKALFDIYHDGVAAVFNAAGKSTNLRTITQPLMKIAVYALLFCALIFAALYINDAVQSAKALQNWAKWLQIALWATAALVAAPVVMGLLMNVEDAVGKFFSLSAVGLEGKPALREKVVRFFSTAFSSVIILAFAVVYMCALAYCLPLGDFSMLGAVVIMAACFLLRKRVAGIKTTLEGRFSIALKRDLQNAMSSRHEMMTERLKSRYKWSVEVSEVEIDELAEVAGKRVGEIQLRSKTGAEIVAIRRGGLVSYNINSDTRLFPNDVVVLCGTSESNADAEKLLSSLQFDTDAKHRKVLDDYQIKTYILPATSTLAAQTLGGTNLNRRFGVKVLAVSRGEKNLRPSAELEFSADDKILAMGAPDKLDAFAQTFGLS